MLTFRSHLCDNLWKMGLSFLFPDPFSDIFLGLLQLKQIIFDLGYDFRGIFVGFIIYLQFLDFLINCFQIRGGQRSYLAHYLKFHIVERLVKRRGDYKL